MKKCLIYESPKVDVIEVQVEKGFANSLEETNSDANADIPEFDPWG